MQHLIDCFSRYCSTSGLTISISKTKIMYHSSPGKPYVGPNIIANDQRLEVVETFVYLGSTLNKSKILKIDAGKSDPSNSAKIKVYSTCVLSFLSFACETWILYKHHHKILERFHLRSLRHIMNVHWSLHVPDTEILERTNFGSIECLILKHRLRWAGKLVRVPDHQIPKQVFNDELVEGKRA